MECRIPDCTRDVYRKLLCSPHYRRLNRYGDPLAGRAYRGSSEADRFHGIGWDTVGDCWIWLGSKNGYGYGQLSVVRDNGRKSFKGAHRASHEIFLGPIPDGTQVDHRCHNEAMARGECDGGPSCVHRACVNPDHLRAVTLQENIAASPRRVEMIVSKNTRHVGCRLLGCTRSHHGSGWCVTHGRRAAKGMFPGFYRIKRSSRIYVEVSPSCLVEP